MNKPVLISTGVADLNDIDVMINLLKKKKIRKFLYYIAGHFIQQNMITYIFLELDIFQINMV